MLRGAERNCLFFVCCGLLGKRFTFSEGNMVAAGHMGIPFFFVSLVRSPQKPQPNPVWLLIVQRPNDHARNDGVCEGEG